MASVRSSAAWKALETHHRAVAGVHMRDLFSQDAERFSRFSLSVGEVFLDYAKNRVTAETMALLFDLARQADVEGWRDRMFRGDKINTTEGRAVLHTALRNRSGPPVLVDGEDVTAVSTDAAGNSASTTDAVGVTATDPTVDSDPPTVPDLNNSVTGDDLSGIGEPGTTITLTDANGDPIVDSNGDPVTATVAADGSWSVSDIDPDLTDGDPITFEAVVRIDTPKERDYFENGGILHYVLRQLAA